MNKTDLQVLYTLVGPTVTRLIQDPLAVLRLKKQLYIYDNDNELEVGCFAMFGVFITN